MDTGGRFFFRAWSVGWVNSNTIGLGHSSQGTDFKVRGPDRYDLDHESTSWPMQCQGSHSLKEDHEL